MKRVFSFIADLLVVAVLAWTTLALPSCTEKTEPMTVGAACRDRGETASSTAKLQARFIPCAPPAKLRKT